MTVTLRERTKAGQISLYLDYYHRGKRQYEYLRLYLFASPRTTVERAHNKQTRQLAETIKAKRYLEIQNGIYSFSNLALSENSFLSYFELLTEKRKDSPGNYGNWVSALRHIQAFSRADIRFSDLDRKWLEQLKEYLIKTAKTKDDRNLSLNSCVSYYNKVKATLREAVKDGYLQTNPSDTTDSIKEGETRREFLTLEELQRASKASCDSEIIKSAFLFSALTGLRFSDVQKLKWSEIQHSEELGYYIRFKQKKTKGEETLPIPENAIELLGKRLTSDEPVFRDLIYNIRTNRKIKEWMIRAGIEKYITFHCARHTYATLQLTLGTDIYTVSKLLGHKNIRTTEIYAKVVDDKKVAAANRINIKL